ncbi:TonB-dependent receptor [Erythrobacter sp. NE805]|uniref:TonB-dependent receptor n=1 Tax=Erythrobacter sp. NE805 TaxID=3389875 RepID=UPI00396B1643
MAGQFKSAFAIGVSTIALGIAVPAAAQDSAAGAEAAADATVDQGIGEIIVTSQRREENLQDVPISVSAFTGEQILARGTTDIGRLEGLVPGFTFGRSGQDARPSIRGVRTENVGVNGDTTIGFFIDGVYQSRAAQATQGFVDIERLEVQRGPQGTLYGRNTFGGNIAITTAQPKLGETLAGLDVTVGQYGRFRTDAFVNLPVSDTLAVRVAGSFERSDGWVENVNPLGNNLFDDKSEFIRGTLLWEPNDRFSAAIKVEHASRGGAGGSAFGYKIIGSYFDVGSRQQLYNATPVRNLNTRGGNRDGVNDALPGSSVATSDLGIPIFAPGDGYRIDTDQPTILDLENTALTANLAYDFGGVTLRSITGYTDFGAVRTSDSDFSGNQIAIDYQNTEAKTFSQELQLLSSDSTSRLQWVLGAYYFHDELRGVFINQQLPRIIRNVTPNLNLAQNGAGFYDEQRATTESIAFYGQATYELADGLRVTGGLRWTEDTKDFAFANANAILPTSGTPPVPQGSAITLATGPVPASAFGVKGAQTNCTYTSFPPPRAGFQCLAANTTVLTGATYDTAKFRKATWRLAVDYDVTPDNLLYASVSTGFRSGGFNSGQGPAALQPTFDPEEVTAYEVGSKNRFAGDTVQLNLSAFYNRYNSLQEQRQVPQGSTTLSIIENSGKARAYGAEAEALWRPVPGLEIGANLAYLNAKYTEYDQVPAPFGTSILVNDASVTAPTIVNGVQIAAAGQRRVFAPGYSCGLIPGTGGTGQAAAAFGCDISGNRIPHSPQWTGAVFASYEIDLGSLGKLTPFAIMNFSSSFFGQPFNSILERQESFQKLDLRLTYAPSENISVQAFVNNVTDERTINRFVWGGGGALQASYAPPRQWGALLSVRF